MSEEILINTKFARETLNKTQESHPEEIELLIKAMIEEVLEEADDYHSVHKHCSSGFTNAVISPENGSETKTMCTGRLSNLCFLMSHYIFTGFSVYLK